MPVVTADSFTDELDKYVDVRYLNNGNYQLLSAFNYSWRGQDYPVPAGYDSDGFSIPEPLQFILPKIPKRGLKASILHDYYVEHGDSINVPREIADEIFNSSLQYLDVKTRRVCIYYAGVSAYTSWLKFRGLA